MNNFNLVAPFYDHLARCVFGRSILRSQVHFLEEITDDDHVLILGGGTGEILEYLPACRSVTFCEKSSKMMALAKERSISKHVLFINDDLLTAAYDSQYDVIICPFILDCFTKTTLNRILKLIKTMLTAGGRLIVTDFQRNKNGLLLLFMHLFFNVFALLESASLKNIHQMIVDAHFQAEKEVFFCRNQIFSRIYRNL